MARHRPATLVHPGRRVTWYGDDTQRSRAIALLNALMDSWGRRGGFWTATPMDMPGHPYPPYPKLALRTVNPPSKYPSGETLPTAILDATITARASGRCRRCRFQYAAGGGRSPRSCCLTGTCSSSILSVTIAIAFSPYPPHLCMDGWRRRVASSAPPATVVVPSAGAPLLPVGRARTAAKNKKKEGC